MTKQIHGQTRAEIIETLEQLIEQTERECAAHRGTLVIAMARGGYHPVVYRDRGYALMGGETAFFHKGTAGAVATRLVELWRRRAATEPALGELTLSVMPVDVWCDAYIAGIRKSIAALNEAASKPASVSGEQSSIPNNDERGQT